MVAGKTYSVKATLKPEYAANFEFIDVNGVVLPDATASTSHEFDYSTGDNDGNGNNGGNNGVGAAEESIWTKMFVITQMASVGVMVGIFILVAVLIAKTNKKSEKKDKSE